VALCARQIGYRRPTTPNRDVAPRLCKQEVTGSIPVGSIPRSPCTWPGFVVLATGNRCASSAGSRPSARRRSSGRVPGASSPPPSKDSRCHERKGGTTVSPKQSSTELVASTLSARSEATVAELASATSLGRSTVGKALIKLERSGEAHRVAGGRQGATRRPDRWRRAGSTSPEPATQPRGQESERLRPGQLDELLATSSR
jgi:hypothetical protein